MMKQYKYEVTFCTGKKEIVYALNYDEAIILAQAEQIKKGNNYRVRLINEIKEL